MKVDGCSVIQHPDNKPLYFTDVVICGSIKDAKKNKEGSRRLLTQECRI
ncbi:mCG147239 [Mus musculus]|nr:mCG147239 [Mus musculus]